MKNIVKIIILGFLFCVVLAGCQSGQQTTGSGTSQTSGSSVTNSTIATHNFELGAVLETYESTIHFTVYSPGGEVFTQFAGSLHGVRYENQKDKESCFLNLALDFEAEDFRFVPQNDVNLTYPCSTDGAFYTSKVKMYDTSTGFFESHEAVLDTGSGLLLVLMESTRGEQYLLVGSADANAEAAEVVAFFETFISQYWPEWWENYNQ